MEQRFASIKKSPPFARRAEEEREPRSRYALTGVRAPIMSSKLVR
jgi:hypothetical protein